MTRAILALNIGSSSVKFQIFNDQEDLPLILQGKISNTGKSQTFIVLEGENERREQIPADKMEDMLEHIFSWIDLNKSDLDIAAVGHRVAHGGTEFKKPIIVTEEIIRKLAGLSSLVPLHQSSSLNAIQLARKWRPQAKQIACFDTAFHSDHSPFFSEYALPRALRDQGIRRYGFHGLSYEWIVHVLKKDYPQLEEKRVVVAHLGSGSSICAIKDLRSIDTTMGMTALDGPPMGTRCGGLDPGAVLYMIKDLGLSPEQVEHTLYRLSGLKALSGLSGDVQELLQEQTASSKFSLDYYSLKVAQYIGMMAVAISGIDAIVFTGGIGENRSEIRESVLKHLTFLMPFDPLVIPTNEERMIAMHVRACQL